MSLKKLGRAVAAGTTASTPSPGSRSPMSLPMRRGHKESESDRLSDLTSRSIRWKMRKDQRINLMRTHTKKPWLEAIHSQGLGSRESCRDLISQGRVRLNNRVECDSDRGVWLRPGIVFKVDMVPFRWFWRLYVAYHKPEGVVSAVESQRSPKHNGHFPKVWNQRAKHKSFHPIFPLPSDVQGLVLYSDDSFLHSHVNVHIQRHGWKPTHVFHLRLSQSSLRIDDQILFAMKNGVQIHSDSKQSKNKSLSSKLIMNEDSDGGISMKEDEQNEHDHNDDDHTAQVKRTARVLSELEKELRMQVSRMGEISSQPGSEDPSEFFTTKDDWLFDRREEDDQFSEDDDDDDNDMDQHSDDWFTHQKRRFSDEKKEPDVQFVQSIELSEHDDGSGTQWRIETIFPRTLNRLIRTVGLEYETLTRVSIGDIHLDPALSPGEWRTMKGREISQLCYYRMKKVTDIAESDLDWSSKCNFLRLPNQSTFTASSNFAEDNSSDRDTS